MNTGTIKPNYQVKPAIHDFRLVYKIIDNITETYIKNSDGMVAIWDSDSKVNADLICGRLNEQASA